jgi:hypothetical protein
MTSDHFFAFMKARQVTSGAKRPLIDFGTGLSVGVGPMNKHQISYETMVNCRLLDRMPSQQS